MPLAGVYKLVWFGPYIHDLLFFFTLILCFGCVFHLLSFALVCQSSICTSIIMLRSIIRTYTPYFLDNLYVPHTLVPAIALVSVIVASICSILSFITPFPLPALVLPISFPMHCSIIHASNKFITVTHTHTCFLEQLYITIYIDNILRFGLVIQFKFVIAIHGLMTRN